MATLRPPNSKLQSPTSGLGQPGPISVHAATGGEGGGEGDGMTPKHAAWQASCMARVKSLQMQSSHGGCSIEHGSHQPSPLSKHGVLGGTGGGTGMGGDGGTSHKTPYGGDAAMHVPYATKGRYATHAGRSAGQIRMLAPGVAHTSACESLAPLVQIHCSSALAQATVLPGHAGAGAGGGDGAGLGAMHCPPHCSHDPHCETGKQPQQTMPSPQLEPTP